MDRSSRLALVGLAALALLFAAGAGTGACAPIGGAWARELAMSLVPEREVELSDLRSDALRGSAFHLPVGVPVAVRVLGSEHAVRTLRLRLDEGSGVEVQLAPSGRGFGERERLGPGRGTVELQVFEEGAALVLTATGEETARVGIGKARDAR